MSEATIDALAETTAQGAAVAAVLADLPIRSRGLICGLTVVRLSDDQWSVWPVGECPCRPSSWPLMDLAVAAARIVAARPGAPVRRAR